MDSNETVFKQLSPLGQAIENSTFEDIALFLVYGERLMAEKEQKERNNEQASVGSDNQKPIAP